MTYPLECRGIRKTYSAGASACTVLADVTLEFQSGQTTVLLGPSGSGKTTLLSILGCLLAPSHGDVVLNGKTVDFRDSRQMTDLRRHHFGFVFQHAQLLPFLTVEANLRLVATNVGMTRDQAGTSICRLAGELGLSDVMRQKPGTLSGGQRQRVSIARAILHSPAVVLADEPTAALDWENGRNAMSLLIAQAKEKGAALVAVTHDLRLSSLFDRVLEVRAGEVTTA